MRRKQDCDSKSYGIWFNFGYMFYVYRREWRNVDNLIRIHDESGAKKKKRSEKARTRTKASSIKTDFSPSDSWIYTFLRHLLHWDVRFFVVTNTLVSMSLCILAFIVKQRNWRIVNWKAQRKLFFSHRMKFNGIDDRREFIAEVYRLYGNCAVNDIHIERDWIRGMERGVRKRAWSTARYTVTNSFSLVRCSLNDLINNWIHIALRVTNDVCIDRVTNIKSNCLAAWDAKYNRTFLINYLPQALLPNVITCNSVTGEASSCPHSHFIGRSIRFIYRCHTI